jgi:hypothetical protein
MAKLPGVFELMATAASPAINFGRGLLGYQDPFLTQTMQDRMTEIESEKGPTGNVGYEDYGLQTATPGGRFTGGLMGLALNDPVNFGLAGSIGRYSYGPEGRTGLTYDFTPDQDTGSTGSATLDFINRGGLKGALSRMGTAQAAEVTPTRSLGDVVMEARANEPMDIEDFLGTSTPQDLGFINNAPTIREAVAPIGITDRGRGMATPGTMGAFEMIGGTPVAIGDKLGRQMALEKADFYEAPKSGLDLGSVLSLAGLLSGSNVVKGLGMIANRDKIGRMAGNVRDKVSSGLGSLNRKMRGVNPDGTTRTQRQYEAAREQRRKDRRVEKMLERKAAGKSYSQKNLNKLTTGGSKPGTYTAKGAGSGGSTSGGKIVCTMMNERYGFGSFRNKIWMKFHESYGPEYQKGYHAIFLPLVKIAKGEGKINTAVRKVLEHMGRHVTADMFKIMKGKKRDPLGRIYRAIFEPTCRIIGKIKSALGRG